VTTWLSFLAILAFFTVLCFKQASLSVWAIGYTLVALLLTKFSPMNGLALTLMWGVAAVLYLLNIKRFRIKFISSKIFSLYKKFMPQMSQTERDALEAGTVSWEGDLFSGNPDFKKLLNPALTKLTKDEEAFIEGPVNELCRMLDEWDITHNRADLPEDVWQFIKEKGFLGMIIPKQYGGLEFSATAQVAVLAKVYGRSISAATTIGVPNSLGPGELLLKYGTDSQKEYYLPRLSNGQEIPCFALTGPNAGSDAASIPDSGVVCEQEFKGKKTLGIRLNWDKRYITLCPVATVIGLAFRLFDPEGLLGEKNDIGITCALIPSDTKGVVKGRRHFPLNTAFMNGPTQGKDVFIPMDYVIGGVERVGQGWRMLMECLSAGRAISLPSSALGGAEIATLASGAYARVRKQFNVPIAKFEGIEEPLARLAGFTYIIDAGLTLAASAIDKGAKPAVVGAILKYHTTELARQVSLDSMDIHGGKGICLGPKNYLGRGYQNAPISITVEGANILTRSLIIFGQGAVRCHPHVFNELESALNDDLVAFDQALFAHAGMIISNFWKSVVLGLSDGYLSGAPKRPFKRYYQLIHRYSANLAFMADFSMVVIGADLKRKEKISARLGDMLSMLYLASSVLKRFKEDGMPEEDKVLVDWCCQYLLENFENQMQQLLHNFPSRWARVFLRIFVMPLGKRRKKPSDLLGQKVAQLLTTVNPARKRITRHTFAEAMDSCPVGELEETFHLVIEAQEIEQKILLAVKAGKLDALTLLEQIDQAKAQNIINDEQAKKMRDAEMARQKIIAVDDFDSEELMRVMPAKTNSKKQQESVS
jgi:acyl-CoA dehydrogenase